MFDDFIKRSPALKGQASEAEAAEGVEQMIVPRVERVDESDIIKIKRVESLADLAALPFDGAVSIDAGQLLKVALDYPGLTGVKLVVLAGLPGAVYSAEWDQATWGLERLSYDSLVSEVVTATRVDKMRSDQAGSRQRPEKRQQELTKPRTRHFTDFQAVGQEPDDESETDA